MFDAVLKNVDARFDAAQPAVDYVEAPVVLVEAMVMLIEPLIVFCQLGIDGIETRGHAVAQIDDRM